MTASDVSGSDTPFLQALRSHDEVLLYEDGPMATAQVTVGDHSYGITYHALERFMGRLAETPSPRLMSLFPHLDLQQADQALLAMVLLLKQGKRGSFLRGTTRATGCLSAGWIFVTQGNFKHSTVVTCYPKSSKINFYGRP